MSYQFTYWLNKKQFVQLVNLMKNDLSFNLFVTKNSDYSENKNELIDLIKNKKDLTTFIKHINQNKILFENNINIIIHDLIK